MATTNKPILAKGIDISSPGQGKISNWATVSKNVDFVIIRCGYGKNYTNQDDAQWENNVKACEKYNIPYGVYLYSYATSTDAAKSEAEHALRLIKGHKPQYPVFLDLEESSIAKLGKAKILEIAKTFCYYIEKAGYTFGIYANTNWFNNYLTDSWYNSKIKWLAQYYKEVTYKGSYDIWQYSDSGKVSGIDRVVDMNFCYLSFVPGDINNDGKVTASDARKILRIASGLESASGQAKKNADVNGDGKITAADAREALRIASGLSK